MRDKDAFHTSTHCRHQLFRQSANRHDKTAQGHFPRHRHIHRHFFSGHKRRERRHKGNAGRRSVLRYSSARHVNMQAVLFELFGLIRIQLLHERNRNFRGFLHDITKLTGDRDFAVSLCKCCLNKQNFSTGLRPCKSGYHAGLRR